jgi:hypothetical protein
MLHVENQKDHESCPFDNNILVKELLPVSLTIHLFDKVRNFHPHVGMIAHFATTRQNYDVGRGGIAVYLTFQSSKIFSALMLVCCCGRIIQFFCGRIIED